MTTNSIGKFFTAFTMMLMMVFGGAGLLASPAHADSAPSKATAPSEIVITGTTHASTGAHIDGRRPAGVADCIKAAGRSAGTLSLAVAAAKCGWGVSKWIANSSYYKNNWNRIINACWPNCSNAQILRAWLGLP